ncbi:MAG: sigma-70 family RNA polymerase sigma factor [Ruminococcus sp.]|nr:sigma-70 family RNA polymerase sigma factor [Ruminococcus sp.]
MKKTYKVNETKKTDYSLIYKAQKGDKRAKEFLCLQNKGLVSHMIKTLKLEDNPSIMEDLFQEGYLGIMKAVEMFDEKKKVRFASYACHWIKCYLIRAYELAKFPVNVPYGLRAVARTCKKEKDSFFTANGCEIEDEELKALIPQLMQQRVEDAVTVVKNGYGLSLDAPIENSETETLLSFQASEENIEEDYEKKVLRQQVLEIISETLGEREKEIILRRFGFYGRVCTLEEIGEAYGVTRERIRQLEKESLRILEQAFRKYEVYY